MKYHTQTLTVKEHGHGNCYQTTLACLLDVEPYEIPDFALYFDMHLMGYHWFTIVQNFLKNKYSVKEKDVRELVAFHLKREDFPEQYKDVPYMLSGLSKRGIPHVVIYMNGEMIHDVHPDRTGVTVDESVTCAILERIKE